MGIHFKNSIDNPGFLPMVNPQKKGGVEQGSFLGFLKKVSGNSIELPATRPENLQSDSGAKDALALCQRMALQMNESLLRILSDTEGDNPEDNSMMDDPMALFTKGSNEEAFLSNIRQQSSKIPRTQSQAPGPIAKEIPERINPPPGVPAIDRIIQQAATAYGVNTQLIKGVIQAESDFDPNAISPKGAAGLMQLMPETAKELGVTDPLNPTENIMGGTRYLKQLLDHYDGSVPLALAAYNWGIGNMDSRRSKMPAETKNYVAKITGVELT